MNTDISKALLLLALNESLRLINEETQAMFLQHESPIPEAFGIAQSIQRAIKKLSDEIAYSKLDRENDTAQ